MLGGTHFVGHHIVQALLGAGHRVTVFNRGMSADDLPAEVQRLRGDRDAASAGLQALQGGRWQACIDVSGYTPRQLRASAKALLDQVERYVFVSAVSVYGDPARGPVDESFELLPAAPEEVDDVNGDTYGPLKVACEGIVGALYPGRCALLRAQVVVGPGDPWPRYNHWVQRALEGGAMLAPGGGSDALQVIDVRDLARFVATVVQSGLHGAFNLAGPRFTWREFLQWLGVEQPVWVPAAVLKREGLSFVELPLYRAAGVPRSGLMHVSAAKALAAGLRWTDADTTARDVQAWCRGRDFVPALQRERELRLLQPMAG